MQIIDEVFATIKTEIITAIKMNDNPMSAARMIAVNYQFDPSTSRLLWKAITEIFNTYK